MKKIMAPEKISQYLEQYNLHNIFNANALEYLSIHILQKGEVVLESGGNVTDMSIVLDGRLKVLALSPSGKFSLVDHIDQFSLLGDIEYFTNSPALHMVQACAPTILLDIPHRTIRDNLSNFAPFTYYLCGALVDKIIYASTSTAQRAGISKTAQLCQYLLKVASGYHEDTFPIRMMDISDKLEITDRHMRRMIADLITKKIITKNSRSTLTILDKKRLEQLANE